MAILESSMAEKKSKRSPKSKKSTLLLAQDVNYARNLAANEEKVRKRSLKYLKKYLEQRSQASSLTEDNLRVLWKGLFYAMWMSDKPLVQEECAENIAHLIHCLQFDEAMLFFKIGLVTLQNEWIGIDQLRLDKFLMFVRRLLRQALIVLQKLNFKKRPNEVFAKVLEDTILSIDKEPPLGLFMHFTEIYLEETAKVSNEKLQVSRTLDLLKPYITKLAFANDNRVIKWINKFIFTYLMKQHKLGLEYEDKYKIWKMQGFKGSINQIQKVVVSDGEWEEDEEPQQSSKNKPLDPRAGRVNVELPQILFNSKDIAEAFLEPRGDPRTSKTTRNHLSIWADKYQKLHNGIYPIGVKKLDSKKRKNLDGYDTNVSKAAKRLIKFEQQLLAKEGEQNKRKRGDLNNLDEDLESAIHKKKTKSVLTKECNNIDIDSGKKNLRKEKAVPNKLIFNDESNKTETEEISTKNKTSKKKNVQAIQISEGKNKLRTKIKGKKIKQNKSVKTRTSQEVNEDYWFERNSGVWFVTKKEIDNDGSASQMLNQLTGSSSKGPHKRIFSGSSSIG